jgi:hypothetical protein
MNEQMNNQEMPSNMFGQYYSQVSDFNIIRMRLDTQPLLDQIELFLRGSRFTITEENGKMKSNQITLGVSKANSTGIQSMLNWLSATINPHVVQGNFPVDTKGYSQMYEQYIYEFQINLGNYLVLNLYKFEMNEDEVEGTIDFIMNLTVPFMSRLIGNQERKSYGKTMESKEVHNVGGKIPTLK